MEKNFDKKIQKIANDARNSIANYCINDCKAYCCKNGFLLILSEKELKFVSSNKIFQNISSGFLLKSEKANVLFDLKNSRCLKLTDENTCSKHKSKNRPKICSDYPLFIVKNNIILSSTCYAVKNNLLNSYIIELEKLGLKNI